MYFFYPSNFLALSNKFALPRLLVLLLFFTFKKRKKNNEQSQNKNNSFQIFLQVNTLFLFIDP